MQGNRAGVAGGFGQGDAGSGEYAGGWDVDFGSGTKAVRIVFLKLNDKRIAMQIAIEYNSKYWLLKIGHDEKYNWLSPGVVLINETIKHAYKSGLSGYEFLGTDEDWLRAWQPERHILATLLFYPYNFSGMISFISDGTNHIFKKIRQSL